MEKFGMVDSEEPEAVTDLLRCEQIGLVMRGGARGLHEEGSIRDYRTGFASVHPERLPQRIFGFEQWARRITSIFGGRLCAGVYYDETTAE